MSKKLIVATLIGYASICAATADAAIIRYFDKGSFNSAANVLTTIDFEGYAGANKGFPTSKAWDYSASLTIADTTFTDDDNGRLWVFTEDSYPSYLSPQGNGSYLNENSYVNSPITVTLPGNVTAFSFNAGAIFNNSGIGAVSLSNGDSFSFDYANNNLTFFGFVSDAPITSFSVKTNYTALDDVSFGTAKVPSPGTLALLSLGLLVFSAARSKYQV